MRNKKHTERTVNNKVIENTQLEDVVENKTTVEEEKDIESAKFVPVVETTVVGEVVETDTKDTFTTFKETQYTGTKIRYKPKTDTNNVHTNKKKGFKNMFTTFKKKSVSVKELDTLLVERYQQAIAELNGIYSAMSMATKESELTYLYDAEKAQKSKIAMLLMEARENKIIAPTSVFFKSSRYY